MRIVRLGMQYLEEGVDNLSPHIVPMRLEQCRFQQSVGAFGDIVVGLEVFPFAGQPSIVRCGYLPTFEVCGEGEV